MKSKAVINVLIKIFREKIKYWDFSFNNIAKKVIIVGGILFIIFNIYSYYFALEANKRYSIGKVEKISSGSKGSYTVSFTFQINNKIILAREQIYSYSDSMIGKSYFIKCNYKKPKFSFILLNCPVPDSIKEAPPEGWEKLPCKCNE